MVCTNNANPTRQANSPATVQLFSERKDILEQLVWHQQQCIKLLIASPTHFSSYISWPSDHLRLLPRPARAEFFSFSLAGSKVGRGPVLSLDVKWSKKIGKWHDMIKSEGYNLWEVTKDDTKVTKGKWQTAWKMSYGAWKVKGKQKQNWDSLKIQS